MLNKVLSVVLVCLLILALIFILTGCSKINKESLNGNRNSAGYTAILETPDGEIISGYCTNWRLGGSGAVILDIDGKFYTTHIRNVLICDEEE